MYMYIRLMRMNLLFMKQGSEIILLYLLHPTMQKILSSIRHCLNINQIDFVVCRWLKRYTSDILKYIKKPSDSIARRRLCA